MALPNNDKSALFFVILLYLWVMISYISPLIAALLIVLGVKLFKNKKRITSVILFVIAFLISIYAICFYLNAYC